MLSEHCMHVFKSSRKGTNSVKHCFLLCGNFTQSNYGIFGTIEITDSSLINLNLTFSLGKIAYKQATEASVGLISTQRLF